MSSDPELDYDSEDDEDRMEEEDEDAEVLRMWDVVLTSFKECGRGSN